MHCAGLLNRILKRVSYFLNHILNEIMHPESMHNSQRIHGFSSRIAKRKLVSSERASYEHKGWTAPIDQVAIDECAILKFNSIEFNDFVLKLHSRNSFVFFVHNDV